MISENNPHENKIVSRPVVLDFKKLIDTSADTSGEIEQAFGKDGLGLIAITNIPGYSEARKNFIEIGVEFAKSKHEILKKYAKPETVFQSGYDSNESHMQDASSSLLTSFKGTSCHETLNFPEDPELMKNFHNEWPEHIKNFGKYFTEMGKIATHSQIELLRCFDNYLNVNPEEETFYKTFKNYFYDIQRLIVYHPTKNQNKNFSKDNWLGFHRDMGINTGLICPEFFDENFNKIESKSSGLVVNDRHGKLHEIDYKPDEFIIQAGDTAFYLSCGQIKSTPHAVKTNNKIPDNLYRITLASFLHPEFTFILKKPRGMTIEEIRNFDPVNDKFITSKWDIGSTYKDRHFEAHERIYSQWKNVEK